MMSYPKGYNCTCLNFSQVSVYIYKATSDCESVNTCRNCEISNVISRELDHRSFISAQNSVLSFDMTKLEQPSIKYYQ